MPMNFKTCLVMKVFNSANSEKLRQGHREQHTNSHTHANTYTHIHLHNIYKIFLVAIVSRKLIFGCSCRLLLRNIEMTFSLPLVQYSDQLSFTNVFTNHEALTSCLFSASFMERNRVDDGGVTTVIFIFPF